MKCFDRMAIHRILRAVGLPAFDGIEYDVDCTSFTTHVKRSLNAIAIIGGVKDGVLQLSITPPHPGNEWPGDRLWCMRHAILEAAHAFGVVIDDPLIEMSIGEITATANIRGEDHENHEQAQSA